MILHETLLMLAVLWLFCFALVKCDVYTNLTHFDECRRLCDKQLDGTGFRETAKTCIRECLLSKADNTTVSQITTKPSVNLTTTSPGTSPATDGHTNNCPKSYFPGPSEDVPGDVSGLTVAFVHEKTETAQGWVVNVSWSAPEDVNASMNWRGYLVIWFSMTDSHDNGGRLTPANCKMVPKNQTYFSIYETGGWKYPNNIYLAVVSLPSYEERTELQVFRPKKQDWSTPGLFEPVSIKRRGRKAFQLQSPKGIAILIVAGLIIAFTFMWLMSICISKRAKSRSIYAGFTNADEKKAEKKEDELKDQLIV